MTEVKKIRGRNLRDVATRDRLMSHDPWKECAGLFEIDDAYAARIKQVLAGLPFAASLALDEYLRITEYRYEVRELGGEFAPVATVEFNRHAPKEALSILRNGGWKKYAPVQVYFHALRSR